jgi:hypothetical protein
VILTSDYRPVIASFDTPVDFDIVSKSGGVDGGEIIYSFQVGPFKYIMEIFGDDGRWNVSFELAEVVGSTEELQEYFSDRLKRPISLDEATSIQNKTMGNKYSNIGVADAKGVLSGVINILKHFIKRYDPRCIVFSVFQKDKSQVYQKMIHNLLPDWVAKSNGRGYGFDVCKPDME